MEILQEIRGYRDSDKLINECEDQLKEIKEEKMEAIYQEGIRIEKNANKFWVINKKNKYKRIIALFQHIDGYKDTSEIIKKYEEKILIAEEKKLNNKRKYFIFIIIVIALIIIFVIHIIMKLNN